MLNSNSVVERKRPKGIARNGKGSAVELNLCLQLISRDSTFVIFKVSFVTEPHTNFRQIKINTSLAGNAGEKKGRSFIYNGRNRREDMHF